MSYIYRKSQFPHQKKKMRNLFFSVLELSKLEILFLIEITFIRKYRIEDEKFAIKNILNWVNFKFLFFFSPSSIICFEFHYQKKKKNKKKNFSLSFGHFFFKYDKTIAFSVYKKFNFHIYRNQNINLESLKLCKKKLILWEYLNKIQKIYTENFFLLPIYGENVIHKYEVYQNLTKISSFWKFLKKNPNCCFLLLEILKIICKLRSTYFLEHFSYGLISISYKSQLPILIKIFLRLFKNILSKKEEKKKFFLFFLKKRKSTKSISHGKKFSFREKNKRLWIAFSQKHGWGVFTSYSLNTMAVLLEYRGEYLHRSGIDLTENQYRFIKKNLFFFRLNNSTIVDATFAGNSGRLINHSCLPNCFAKNINHGFKDYLFLISIRNIHKFEELSYDYRINSDDLDFQQATCSCENVYCRKALDLRE